MNSDFENIKAILSLLKTDYIAGAQENNSDLQNPITERDIVAEIYLRLKDYCRQKNLSTHCEIKPAESMDSSIEDLKKLPRIDNVILCNQNDNKWIKAATKFQDKYQMGPFQARFSSVPVVFFHTAIEVKIQSKVTDAKKDINTLIRIQKANMTCNCFFVLLNSRGFRNDHDKILSYAESKGITIIEYSAR